MDSNELREYVQKLNEQEAVQKEIRRQKALNRIKELRRQLKEKEIGNDIHQRIRG